MADSGKPSEAKFDFWTLGVRLLWTVVILSLIALLLYDTLHPAIAIEPITSTKAETDLGLTPQVAAQQLHDELARIAEGADGASQPNLSLEFEKPSLTLPAVGISIDAVASTLREMLPFQRVHVVSGDFTEGSGHISLRLRVDGMLVYQTPGDGVAPTQAQQELKIGAGKVALRTSPYVYATYLHSTHDSSEIAVIQQIISSPTADSLDVADTEKLWGQIMAEQKNLPAAIEHFWQADLLYRKANKIAKTAELQNFIGQAYLQEEVKDYENARMHFQQAIDSLPNRSIAASAWLNLGDVLRVHDPEAALKAYRHALLIAPRLRYARDAEGGMLEELKDFRGAAESYKISITDYPYDDQSYAHLAWLVAQHPDATPDGPELQRVLAPWLGL